MRRPSACTTLVILLATVVVLGIVPYAQADEHKDCSNATLRGSFGYTITGFSFSAPPPLAGPFGQVGRQTFDGNGNTAATATTSLNGHVLPVTFEGTYTVNPDCTGSFTITIFPIGLTQHIDFVIDDDGLEFRAISAESGDVLTAIGRKQFRQSR
jgi:hypothetical protein